MPAQNLPRRISAALLCLLFAVLVYRAKTQSFTIDEAFAFNLFVDRKIDYFLLHYDACNHVLYTLLTKVIRYFLGTSELVLRLVSLLAAALYFVAIHRLSRIALGSTWLHVAAVAALALNPLVLDFLVASRGYGLAVALLMWAIYYAVRWLNESREASLLRRSGLCAGLAISANLTLLIPAAALGAALLLLASKRGRENFWRVIDLYGGPAVIVAFLFLVLPLSRSTPGNFYFGASTLLDAVRSLTSAPWIAIAFVFTAVAIGGIWMLFTKSTRCLDSDLFILTSLTLAASVGTLSALNYLFQVPYPYGRTGLYLIPLFLLSLAASGACSRIVSSLSVAVLAFAVLSFSLQFRTRHFAEWSFDASTKQLMSRIAEDNRQSGRAPFTVAASWLYVESLKYYRKRNRLHWMSPDILTYENLSTQPADYYVLDPADRPLLEKLGLQVLMTDDFTGTVVARGS